MVNVGKVGKYGLFITHVPKVLKTLFSNLLAYTLWGLLVGGFIELSVQMFQPIIYRRGNCV